MKRNQSAGCIVFSPFEQICLRSGNHPLGRRSARNLEEEGQAGKPNGGAKCRTWGKMQGNVVIFSGFLIKSRIL
jgi:hypothetical protein